VAHSKWRVRVPSCCAEHRSWSARPMVDRRQVAGSARWGRALRLSFWALGHGAGAVALCADDAVSDQVRCAVRYLAPRRDGPPFWRR
jgi:hypothetical protein